MGKNSNWTFQIAEVTKVLASVSYLVDNNHRVVFDQDEDTGQDISFITDKTSGDVINMRRDRNVWVIDAYIEEEAAQVFTRPVAAP
jgi:hypothetical protein